MGLVEESDDVSGFPYRTAVRPFFAGTGVTGAGGSITFTFPTPFPTIPIVTASVQLPAGPNAVQALVTAVSKTDCTVTVTQALSTLIALLSLNLLGAAAPLVGATVNVVATVAGSNS
jgi:hypothetical protein